MRLSRRAKRRLIVLIAVVIVAGGGLVGFKLIRTAQQDRLVANARAEGLAAFEAGDFGQTLSQLSYVVQHDKKDLDVLLAYADARIRMPERGGSHLAEALGYYVAAVDLMDHDPAISEEDPRFERALRQQLDLYLTLGVTFELVQTADRVLAMHPDDVDALGAKARALFTDREFDAAVPIAEQLLVLEPETVIWRRFIIEAMNQQGISEAQRLARVDEWIDAHDGDGRYLVLKAVMLGRFGRMDRAARIAGLAAERGADTLDVLQQLVSMLDGLGLSDRATEVVQTARSRFPDEQWVREAIVRRLWQASRTAEAIAEIDAIEQEFDTLDTGVLKLKALLLMPSDRRGEAEAILTELASGAGRADEDAARQSWAAAVLARAQMEEGSWPEVTSAIEQAVLMQREDPVLHFLLGQTYNDVGETASALASLDEAFRLDRNWIAAGVAYCEALLAVGRVGDAYNVSRVVMSRPGGRQAPVYMVFARAYMGLLDSGEDVIITDEVSGVRVEITEILETVFEVMPARPDVAALLGEAYVQSGRPDRARQFMQVVMDDDSTPVPILLALAQLSRKYDLGMADVLEKRAQDVDGGSLEIAFSTASGLAAGGDVEAGLALIDRILAADPPGPGEVEIARLRRAAYLLRFEHPAAIGAVRSLVADYPDSTDTQTFALRANAVWGDRELVRQVIDNLKRLIGETAQQVKLAEASMLLRYDADEEAMLARAIVLINQVLERSPDSLAALTLMARASMAGPNPTPDRAIEMLERAIAVYPRQVELYTRLVSLMQERGDFEGAERYLMRLGLLTEDRPELRRREIELLHAQGDFETALVRAGEVIGRSSSESDQLMLARMQVRGGRYREAEEIYDHILGQDGVSRFAVSQAAAFYAASGRFDQAEELIETHDGVGGASDRAVLLAMLHQYHGDPDQAQRLFQVAVGEAPDSLEARLAKARFHLSRSERDDARTEAMAGLRIEPGHAGLRSVFAVASLGLGADERREAIALLEEVGAENDHLLAALKVMQTLDVSPEGRIRPRPADLAATRRLVEEHGQFMPTWLLAISVHVEAGLVDDAIGLARQAVGRLPATSEPPRWATDLLVTERRWDEALVEAAEWRRRSLDDPVPADLIIASIMLEQGRAADAVAQLATYADRFRVERVEHPERLALWLRALVLAGRSDDAMPVLGAMVADASWRRRWLGLVRFMPADATYESLSAIEAVAVDPMEKATVAVEWSRLGRSADRPECFGRAQQLVADLDGAGLGSTLALVRGAIAEARDDLAAAEAIYREVLGKDPDQTVARNNLAFMLADSGSADEAVGHIEHALRIQPEQPDLLDTYAFVLLQTGRPERAEQTVRQAMEYRRGDLGLRIRLIETLVAQERWEEADEAYRVIALDVVDRLDIDYKHHERLEAIRGRLEQASTAVSP